MQSIMKKKANVGVGIVVGIVIGIYLNVQHNEYMLDVIKCLMSILIVDETHGIMVLYIVYSI